ncbi:hypothetical protein GW17_00047442 [Ensete ventricosum]|nr:hypothetical protein GW17_00047442 [Ensete ventricosum]
MTRLTNTRCHVRTGRRVSTDLSSSSTDGGEATCGSQRPAATRPRSAGCLCPFLRNPKEFFTRFLRRVGSLYTMAEEHNKAVESGEEVAVHDRGLFDFTGKKKDEERKECHEEEEEEEVLVTGMEKVQIEEGEMAEEEKKMGLLEKLHRSHSSSSNSLFFIVRVQSSDDEEEAEGENKEKKKKKKKGLKEKIKEKLGCEEEAQKPEVEEGTAEVVEKMQEETVKVEATPPEQEKGLLEKIKEKLPGHKKPADEAPAPPSPGAACAGHGEEHEGDEVKEKKGILGRIMEKLPGFHKTEEKEGEKKSPSK